MKQLLWFRDNLRINDNALFQLTAQDKPVVGMFVWSDRLQGETPWGFPKMGVHRARFLQESLQQLKKGLEELNIPLYILIGDPIEVVPDFIRTHGVTSVFVNREWAAEERNEVEGVQALTGSCDWKQAYDQFLIHPDDLPFETLDDLPKSFTPFRKKCEARARVRDPLPSPQAWPASNFTDTGAIPGLAELGYSEDPGRDPRSAFPFRGGFLEGQQRLQHYFWESGHLSSYKETRNGMVGTEYSSKFSPWLANGSLSARDIYQKVRQYEQDRGANQSTYWLIFELFWRDYFRYVSLRHGDEIFGAHGISQREHRWNTNKAALKAWTQASTGIDFIDANMKELELTGWMSNRGRQVCASYWAKDLGQDWRIGASWFESQLIDYDVHSNWGNWMYQAGVGNDPRDRRFNIDKQASTYDRNREFRSLWLAPEKQHP